MSKALTFHWMRFIFIHFSLMVAKITFRAFFFAPSLPFSLFPAFATTPQTLFSLHSTIFRYSTRFFPLSLSLYLSRHPQTWAESEKVFSKPKRKFANSFKFWQPIYTAFKFEKLLKRKYNKFPCDFNSQLKKTKRERQKSAPLKQIQQKNEY